MKRYRVALATDEREERERRHALALLKADVSEGGPAWRDDLIVEAIGCSAAVRRVWRRFLEEGLAIGVHPV